MILKSLLFFAFAGLFVYDGVFAWPNRNIVAHEYFEFIESGKSKHDWPAYAKQKGLKDYELGSIFAGGFGTPKKEYKHEHVKDQRQLNEQFWWAGGLALIGLGFLGKIVLDRKKVLAYDDTALISPEGKRVPLESIKEIDTAKWEKKGLGYVRYEENGELRKLVLDDLKYDGAEKVLEKAQAHLGLPLESELRAAAKERARLATEQTPEDLQPPKDEG